MYTEGIKVGDNSYILSDEDGTLTLLNGKGTIEETEEYIKLKNAWEEEIDNHRSLQNKLSKIHSIDKSSKKDTIEALLSVILIDGLFIVLGVTSIEVLSLPLAIAGVIVISKPVIYGTKKQRKRQKEEIKEELQAQTEKVKEIEKKMNKLKKKVETETYFWKDEIIPVTSIENKKTNVKMRVLKLEQSR